MILTYSMMLTYKIILWTLLKSEQLEQFPKDRYLEANPKILGIDIEISLSKFRRERASGRNPRCQSNAAVEKHCVICWDRKVSLLVISSGCHLNNISSNICTDFYWMSWHAIEQIILAREWYEFLLFLDNLMSMCVISFPSLNHPDGNILGDSY